VNQGDAEAALATLQIAGQTDLKFAPPPPSGHLAEALRELIVEGYRGFLTTVDSREALEKLSDFRVLCALRRGPWGVENLNRVVEQILTDARLIEPTSPLYKGRPILILQNDPQLKLFNGDLGLLLPDPDAGHALRACFLESGGAVRRLLPARLPQHETAFAMTVHKSQGSEFDRVLLVLPERDSPVVTRELVYTGLTRARSAVELWADETLLRLAINRRTQRTSGLRDKLWPK
jgi:exodeoxyribonuclease V alpha subunit